MLMMKTLMEGKSGTQHGGYDHIPFFCQRYVQCAQWSLDSLGLILQGLRKFIGHDFADSLHIVAEEGTVLLITFVTKLGHEMVHDGVLFAEVYYFHGKEIFSKDSK